MVYCQTIIDGRDETVTAYTCNWTNIVGLCAKDMHTDQDQSISMSVYRTYVVEQSLEAIATQYNANPKINCYGLGLSLSSGYYHPTARDIDMKTNHIERPGMHQVKLV